MQPVTDKNQNKRLRLAVVVPSFNGGNDLERCLEALMLSDYDNLEIILVDNHSSDVGVQRARAKYPTLNIIEHENNLGFTGACLRGYEEAKKIGAVYLALINQDCFVEASMFSQLIDYLEAHSEATAAQPLILLDQNRDVVNSAGNCIHYLGFGYSDREGTNMNSTAMQRYLKEPRRVAYASGAALVLKMLDLNQFGLFSEDFFMYHEDLDLGWRISLFGKQSVLVPSARAYHRYEFSRSTRIKYYYGERNRLIVLLENYHLATLLLIFPAWFVMEIGVVLFATLKGWLPLKLKGYLYVIVHFSEIMKERSRRQSMRKTKDRDVIRTMSAVVEYQTVPSLPLRIVNPLLAGYWRIIRSVIFW
ncbi:MAG: glycosyltransferase family 2 protein [Patescibacteria group bacterium]|jgi:hypothetical protein